MERNRMTRRCRRGAVSLAAVVGLVLAACGSDTTGMTANAPAGAKENAVGDAVCFDWPDGTVAKPCAVELKGPGGGRIFYDAGTVQPWGRFLEVAPQDWNGTLYKCPGSGLTGSTCGSADKQTIPLKTGDWGPSNAGTSDRVGDGYKVCHSKLQEQIIPKRVGIGDGRVNTEELFNDPRCTNVEPTAITLAKGYRGGGFTDWYLPSKDEILELCKYGGRNQIGGFSSDKPYAASSVGHINFQDDLFSDTFRFGNCSINSFGVENRFLVRPIRAF